MVPMTAMMRPMPCIMDNYCPAIIAMTQIMAGFKFMTETTRDATPMDIAYETHPRLMAAERAESISRPKLCQPIA